MTSLTIGRRVAAACTALLCGGASLPAAADVSFTPRIGYYFDNGAQRQSSTNFNSAARDAYYQQQTSQLGTSGVTTVVDPIRTAANTRQTAFPQYGGTLTFDWGTEGSQVALTALYGTSSVRGESLLTEETFNYTILGTRIVDTFVTQTLYDTDYKRLDLEATFQHRLNETFSFIGGIRGERTTGDRTLVVISTASTNAINFAATKYNDIAIPLGLPPFLPTYWIPAPAATVHQDIEFWRYSVRAGAAAYAPVGEKHLFYVNGLLQVTRQPRVKVETTLVSTGATQSDKDAAETSVGPDISVGYMYRVSDRFGIDARYRATVYFPVSGPFDFKDSRVNHGVGLGFTTWFGDR
jgi:hypothetical protein